MNMRELVAFKERVRSIDSLSVYRLIMDLFRDTNVALTGSIDFDDLKNQIRQSQTAVTQELQQISEHLSKFQEHLEFYIANIEAPYYARSQQLYVEGSKDTPDYILDRALYKKLLYQQDALDLFLARVKLHSHWRYPAAELRPLQGDITDSMVGSDLLYLLDTHQDLFKNVKGRWSPEFQRRIRYYTFDEDSKKMFHQLPVNQFGLFVTVDYFNFRPMEIISKYLQEIFQILRPGGVAMFTYNNCDRLLGVDNFENGYYCYTPGRKIREVCKNIGFEVITGFDLENNVSWLEVKKPGELTTIKGGQALARITAIESQVN